VSSWIDTGTEHGWIHAEKQTATGSELGWLPSVVFQKLAANHRWMKARQQWKGMDESQCNVEEGAALVVWMDSRTQEGWTYAEDGGTNFGTRSGWLPVFCLEWNED